MKKDICNKCGRDKNRNPLLYSIRKEKLKEILDRNLFCEVFGVYSEELNCGLNMIKENIIRQLEHNMEIILIK